MLYYLLTLGLVAHTCFWGAGAAWLALPRAWKRFWWVFAPVFGLALQSMAVWLGAHSSLAGTDQYAWRTEVIPALLLGLAIFRMWQSRRVRRPRGWRSLAAVSAIGVCAGWLLVSPLTVPGRGIYPSSLGSCDAADYAAGARVLQEFARDDRTGFLDLPEVTTIRSTKYFFDSWLRLNHFTPSAVLAHNASIFGVESYRLVAVAGSWILLLALPLVMFLARVVVGIRGRWLLVLVALFAVSPLNAYAVHHVALGQLFAAQGIALLTLGIVGATRAAQRGRSAWGFLGVLTCSIWILAGSYNFILVVCLAPAALWLVLQAFLRRDLRSSFRVLLVTGVALEICLVLAWERFDGLVERFSLFEEFDFGWSVPLLFPDGWLGLVRGSTLAPWMPLMRASLAIAVVVGWLGGMVGLWRRGKRDMAVAAFALVATVAVGWALLARESMVRVNASYDAYKILSVFLPGLIAGLCCWLAVRRPGGARWPAVVAGLLLAGNLWAALDFRRTMSVPPLRLDRTVVEIGALEKNPAVASVNLLIGEFWSRLWANAFLLRKPQYFALHTYEGRRNTELKGEWNLSDSLLRSVPLDPSAALSINAKYHAVRVAAEGRIGADFATGWHQLEGRGVERWRWGGADAKLRLENPRRTDTRVVMTLRVRGASRRDLVAMVNGQKVGTWQIGQEISSVTTEPFTLPGGTSELQLASTAPAISPPGDSRPLSVAIYGVEIRAVPTGTGQPEASERR